MDSISPQDDAPSDLQLLQSFSQQHDQAAFTQLVLRHNGLVKRVCWRILGNEQDAEDAVQAVFMVLARRARLVAWQTSIANWLYGTAWRIAKRETRRKNKLPRQDHDMNEHPAEPSSLSETQVDEELLYPAIYSLPSKCRSAIVLCLSSDQGGYVCSRSARHRRCLASIGSNQRQQPDEIQWPKKLGQRFLRVLV